MLEPDDLCRSTLLQLIFSPFRTIEDTKTSLAHVLKIKMGKPGSENVTFGLIEPRLFIPTKSPNIFP